MKTFICRYENQNLKIEAEDENLSQKLAAQYFKRNTSEIIVCKTIE